VARARRVVTGLLRRWGLAAEVPDFELAVSELVSNALVHGAGRVHFRLSCDQGARVRLEVGDEGRDGTRPHLAERRTGGWGLRFVDQVAESWGAERGGEGTLVWMVKRAARGGGVGDARALRVVSPA